MANFTTKTIKEIFDSFMSQYTVLRSKYGDTSPLLQKSFIKTIGYAIAGVAATLWQLSVWIYKQIFPQTCELPALKFWGSLIGVEYNQGQSANLTILLNKVTASYLVSGTIYKDLNSGLIYKTISQANAENGQILTTVQCTSSGSIGNLPIDTVLNIANPIDGIPSTAIVTELKIEGSEDEEVESYRKRVLQGFKKQSRGGAALDYYNWAMEVQGIVDVLPYVLEEGTITLYLIGEGSGNNRNPSGTITPNPFPEWIDDNISELKGSGDFLAVANSIEGDKIGVHNRRPLNAKVKLLSPIYKGFSISITDLTDQTFNNQIKNILIENFDKKRPNIRILNYSSNNARINLYDITSVIKDVIGEESFSSISLKMNNQSITEYILGVGELAYLAELNINGTKVIL